MNVEIFKKSVGWVVAILGAIPLILLKIEKTRSYLFRASGWNLPKMTS
jgi:hypothetical protein